MLINFKESFVLLMKNKQLILPLLLIALLSTFNQFTDVRIIKILVFCAEFTILVIAYVNIIILSSKENGNHSFITTTKNAFVFLSRFVGLFVYFLVAAIIILVPEAVILKNFPEISKQISIDKGILLYINLFLILLLLCPFYLYSPMFIILKNCFVYESIREGYKFIMLKPVQKIIPSVLIIFFAHFKDVITIDNYILLFIKNLLFLLVFFYAVNIAVGIFKKSNISYVSTKTKVEEEISEMGIKKKFFMTIRKK